MHFQLHDDFAFSLVSPPSNIAPEIVDVMVSGIKVPCLVHALYLSFSL